MKLRALPAVKTRSGGYRGIIPLGYIGASDRYGDYYLPRTYRSQALPVMVRMHHSSADACLMHPQENNKLIATFVPSPQVILHGSGMDGLMMVRVCQRLLVALYPLKLYASVRKEEVGKRKSGKKERDVCLLLSCRSTISTGSRTSSSACLPPPFFLQEFPPCGNLQRSACAQLVYMIRQPAHRTLRLLRLFEADLSIVSNSYLNSCH